MPDDYITITPDMTVLDIISRYQETEHVFNEAPRRPDKPGSSTSGGVSSGIAP